MKFIKSEMLEVEERGLAFSTLQSTGDKGNLSVSGPANRFKF